MAVQNCPLLKKTTRGLLYWVLREPSDALTVKRIRIAFDLGEKAWVTQREILKEIGVLTQFQTILQNGTSLWTLNFDFTPLFEYLPKTKKGGDHARVHVHARDPFLLVGSRAGVRSTQKGGDQARGVNKEIQGTPNTAPPLGGMGSGAPGDNDGKSLDSEFLVSRIENHPSFFQERTISKNSEAKKFFNFLDSNGIFEMRIDAINRTVDSERGALLACKFFGDNIKKSNSAVYHFDNFVKNLFSKGKIFDLQTAAAENQDQMAKSIFVDVLKTNTVEKLKEKWKGPIAVLETSSKNFQAILIMDSVRVRADRLSIQRQIATEFCSDSSAVSSTQLHRFPGSINHGKGGFVCRLVELRNALGASNEIDFLKPILQPELKQKVMNKKPMMVSTHNRASGSDGSNSGVAFGRSIEMMREGRSREEIIAFLSRPEWITHHSKDWPERTWRAASAKFKPAARHLH